MKPALAVLVAVLTATPALADGALLPLQKTSRPVWRIESPVAYPDHMLLVRRQFYRLAATGPDNAWGTEVELFDLTPDKPIELRLATAGERNQNKERAREFAEVWIAPRARAVALVRNEGRSIIDALGWPLQLDWRVVTPSWAPDGVTVTYQVRPAANGTGPELVLTSPNPLRQWNVAVGAVALCLTAALIGGGLWLFRRRKRRNATPSA